MKLKRNSLTTLLVVSFLLMALSGCGQQAEPDSAQPPLETVTYSNLTDADSRKLLTEALADANVDETRTKRLLDRVDQFNASVKSEWLTGGFESAATTETRYDPYEMQDLWTEKNGSFPGYNCRITAFSLFGEFVTVDASDKDFAETMTLSGSKVETVTALDAKSCVQVLGRLARQNIQTPLRALLSVLSFTLLSAFLTGFSGSGLLGQNSSVYSTASALVIAALIAAQCADTVSLCCATIGICADFVFAFFPAFLVILTVSGSSLTGVSTNTLLLGLAQGLNILSAKLFVPLINCFLALSLCSGVRSSLNIDGALRVVRKGLISLISFCAGAFVTVLSVKTAVASRADALGLRSLRFAINSVVPVIGSAISEGLLSIQSYAGLVKSTVGVVGIIGVIALFLPALINVIGWRVSIAVSVAVSEIFDDRTVCKMLRAFGDAFLLMNVVLILSMVTTVISIGILIAAKGAAG